MISFIDNFLNRITMYRLALYYLIFLLIGALGLSFLGLMPFGPFALLFSTAVLLLVCWIANKIFAGFLRVQANVESVYITALILALIISPPAAGALASTLTFLFWVSVLAMASKYILNIKNKHIFNPAALAVAITSFTINRSASWWVGTPAMLFFVLIGGLLVVRKVRRYQSVLAFFGAALITMIALSFGHGNSLLTVQRAVIYSPMIFFAAVMFTEPLTMPATRDGQLAFGVLVGWLFAPQTHIGSLYFTPELALLAGNIFAYIVSPKARYQLKLKQKNRVGAGVYDFIFQTSQKLKFKPGQYMEWTLGHKQTDSRGNRRYFTLASSPTEKDVLLGVKFYENSSPVKGSHGASSFKTGLSKMNIGDEITAGQLAGDFILPDDKNQKLAFIAGGIGITPFRSMLKYLVDTNQHRSIVVFYSNRDAQEIAYMDVFKQAAERAGVKTVFTLTNKNVGADWQGYRGHISEQMVAKEIPDFKERLFYISGSGTMVDACKKLLVNMGVSGRKIKTDFFPGLV
jgi:ferredoxin-NADP reductase